MSRMTDTSRSPYTVSASVRGMGVAVITSTSGIRPFRSQRRALDDAETVLLVDDGEAQRSEVDGALHQRVRADDQIDVARRKAREQIAPLQAGRRAGDELDAKARFLQQLSQAEEVLLGENLRRRHERHLQAVLHGDERRQQRDDRLARADVALQQPVHRRRALHVFDDLFQRGPLPFRQLERQNAARRFADAIVDLDRPRLRLADRRALAQHQARAETERTLRR